MDFILNADTSIVYDGTDAAVKNAVGMLERDMKKSLGPKGICKNQIILTPRGGMDEEEFCITAEENISIYAGDSLGFVYALLYISEKFLGIQPFWFWMDQKIDKKDSINVKYGEYRGKKPIVKYRGWFVNDEVLIMRWNIDGDEIEPWRMVFEALLRCGGNLVIPGTDKNSKKYRQLASDMGLWITHHHAEPLGAEMFVRKYSDMEPDYSKTPELFHRLWEEAAQEQKDLKVVWALGFRGQGDCPFWSHDTSGRFDTPEKRGKLISDIIELQRQIVQKYVKNPVFCTNLYGEIMELYEEGHIALAEDIIKISADNGYGKMVTRRRDNHTVRISSMPKSAVEHGGIYYHISFYDLQAANHITMLPNSVDFVNRELNEVTEKNMNDYWIVNCSNVRPHVYFLDALRKKWYGEEISDESHSLEFCRTYFENEGVKEAYRAYHEAMLAYGSEEDEHAGEQFYTENIRLLVHSIFNQKTEGTTGLKWLLGMHPLAEQSEMFADICRRGIEKTEKLYKLCGGISETLADRDRQLFGSTVYLHAAIHYYCARGVIVFNEGFQEYEKENYKNAFMLFGDSAKLFERANSVMRGSEYGVWKGFYFNDCFADIKHTAYMVEKLMGYVRERGDNSRHDKWYRDAVYAPEDRRVMTLLVNDNHMTDWELYEAFKNTRYE